MPVGEVALALGCLLDKVFGGFGRFWGVWRVLEGGPTGQVPQGVPVGEGVWRVWRVLEGLEGFEGGWNVWKVLEGDWRVWKVLEGLEGLESFGGRLEGLEGFGAFGGFWSVWSVCGLANGSFESP